MTPTSHQWKPVSLPQDLHSLEVQELRPFEKAWRKQREALVRHNVLQQFLDRMARWWSIETGVIERIYSVSEGVTIALVEQGFHASLIPHGESDLAPEALVEILNDHKDALDMLMDVVGGTRALSVGWIKELHALFTQHQNTTQALDPQTGRLRAVPLLRGQFKQQSNSPRIGAALEGVHQYCPPEHVASEMDRLIELYGQIPEALPEVRSAWLHHAFTQIHPFQDGNGRVARALASIDFIKVGLFPLLVTRKERTEYLDHLRRADDGQFAPLVAFFAQRQQDILGRALSEATQSVDSVAGRQAVLMAAKDKVLQRQQQHLEQRQRLTVGMEALVLEAERVLSLALGQTLQEVPGVRGSVQRSRPDNHHWYRQQMIEIGRQFSHWVDLVEPRYWVRLQLRDGGITDLVVALHLIGNPSPGAGGRGDLLGSSGGA